MKQKQYFHRNFEKPFCINQDQRKRENLNIRLDTDLLNSLKLKADAKGEDVSSFVRNCLRSEIHEA